MAMGTATRKDSMATNRRMEVISLRLGDTQLQLPSKGWELLLKRGKTAVEEELTDGTQPSHAHFAMELSKIDLGARHLSSVASNAQTPSSTGTLSERLRHLDRGK